jgi:hypothetical protein
MNGRHMLFVAGCVFLATSALGQDRAVPRSGGGGHSAGAGSHPSPSAHPSSSSRSGGSSSTQGTSSYSPTLAERRHPRAGTGTGWRQGGYYPSHPIYPGYPGWGWGGYYPAYWSYWWPYGYSGYGWGGGYWGSPWGAGAIYTYERTDQGSLRVLVDPVETRVYVDGYYAGVADDFDGLFQRLHVAPGRHEISLKLTGYQTHRVRVYVSSGATIKLDHEMREGTGETFEDLTPDGSREARHSPSSLAPPSTGTAPEASSGELHLQVEPVDASVYVDGEFQGTGREATTLSLAPGPHRVEVVRPGYRTAEHEVEVSSSGVAELSVELKRP